MAKNITVNTRIQHKKGTSTEWAQATNFTPLAGELIVYTDLNKIKVGDGNTSVNNLSFVEPKGGCAMFGTCATAAGTAAKVVSVTDTNWELKVGAIIGIKFTYTNTASNVTLNVNSTGAKSIWYNQSKYTGNSSTICGYANRLNYYMYDGTYWCWLNFGAENDSNTYTSAYCATSAATAAKTASCTNYALLAKSYTQITMVYANTSAGALTLNINGEGAKSIYINGAASSSSNYTLPAGTYFIYYDGTNYYFRTDGKLTVNGELAALVSDIPTKVSQLDNDSGYLTSHQLLKSLATTATSAQTATTETLTGGGTIKLHKIAKTGTYSDLIGKPTFTLNGAATTTPSFYAPTSAGTSGYVLTSNGSGAPTWKAASSSTKLYEHNIELTCKTYYTAGAYYMLKVYLRKLHTKATTLTVAEVFNSITELGECATGSGRGYNEDIGGYPNAVVTHVYVSGGMLWVDAYYFATTSSTNISTYSYPYSQSNVAVVDKVRQVN